ncbi:hypothetical protein CY0110_07249 [Crocosphaera chwakensis CCY0110]|uniref:Uncharacterized protein n=2 Tax=Crocosphaera TaxID=263510 RepID=A3IU99_9CHRO|nr:hypothetical protein CY0110_07249 [Crocosphaera chwakensis CCY0110]
MRHEAREWFSKIKKPTKDTPPINTDFDLYYLCLMMGLASKNKSTPDPSHSADFVDRFVKQHERQQNLIIGLLIQAELSDKSLTLDDKNQAKKILKDLIDPTNRFTSLTDDGMDKMNAYASGGFDYLQSKMPKPYFAEDFLIRYVEILKTEMDNNHNW